MGTEPDKREFGPPARGLGLESGSVSLQNIADTGQAPANLSSGKEIQSTKEGSKGRWGREEGREEKPTDRQTKRDLQTEGGGERDKRN